MFLELSYDQEAPEWRTLVADQEGEYSPWSACIGQRRCSVCFGSLIREWNYDQGIVEILCNSSCLPAGRHVGKTYVERQWEQDEEDWKVVSANYPALAEREMSRWPEYQRQ